MYPCNWILSLVFLVLCGVIRAMYIEVVPNRKSPPAILLRQAYREDGKVKKRTLANLTDWPKELIEGFRALLKGGRSLPPNGRRCRSGPRCRMGMSPRRWEPCGRSAWTVSGAGRRPPPRPGHRD